jgi:hypothetical protein
MSVRSEFCAIFYDEPLKYNYELTKSVGQHEQFHVISNFSFDSFTVSTMVESSC